MTRVGFEPQISRLVAYVLPPYAAKAAGMMGLSRLYKTGIHVVMNSHSVIGCRVCKLEVTYTVAGRVPSHYVKCIWEQDTVAVLAKTLGGGPPSAEWGEGQ